MERSVAAIVADFLVGEQVTHVFGYQGGAILKLVDEIVATKKITFVQNYHEQASGFCADGYARISGNLGVAMATSGPGATNLITAIANAQLDSVPTLFITGQDYANNITQDTGARLHGFQDLKIVDVVRPITKYARLVTKAEAVAYELAAAVTAARSGRPGASLLDIPIDIQFAGVNQTVTRSNKTDEGTAAKYELDAFFDLLQAATRPVVLVGGGVRLANAAGLARSFAEECGLPVVSTLNGIDAVVGSYGFAGLYGVTAANLAVRHADLLIVLGARMGQRQVGKITSDYTKAKVIHVDTDQAELGRILSGDLLIHADLNSFLRAGLDALRDVSLPDWHSWHTQIRVWEAKYAKNRYVNERGLDPVKFVEQLTRLAAADAIFVNDVGQNQMWVAQGTRIQGEQRLLNSVGLGSMGFSLPCAIGAHFAAPDKQVVAFMGDGGLQINIQELMLIGSRQLPLKVVVFNNRTMAMIREVQSRYFGDRFHGANLGEFDCVNLELLAKAYGLRYVRVDDLASVGHSREWLNNRDPYIVEIPLDIDTRVTNRFDESASFEAEAHTSDT